MKKKVFISYCWSSEEHKEWVKDLGRHLIESDIDVILDVWDLFPGHDITNFMESIVLDSTIDHILVVSDKKYMEKADRREGGVGIEAQIISPNLYREIKQEKIIPIVCEYQDNLPCLPVYLKSRAYFDFSSEQNYFDNLQKLIFFLENGYIDKKPGINNEISEFDVELRRTKFYLSLNIFKREYNKLKERKKAIFNDIPIEGKRYFNIREEFINYIEFKMAELPKYTEKIVKITKALSNSNLMEEDDRESKNFIEKDICLLFQLHNFIVNWIIELKETTVTNDFRKIMNLTENVGMGIMDDFEKFIIDVIEKSENAIIYMKKSYNSEDDYEEKITMNFNLSIEGHNMKIWNKEWKKFNNRFNLWK